MTTAAHIAAGLLSVGMIIGAWWFVRVHFHSYAERMIEVILKMES